MVIKNVFMEVLPDVWPMLIIILVIIVSLRLTYLITKHKKFQLHKEIIYLLAIIYLLIRAIIIFKKLYSFTCSIIYLIPIIGNHQ